MAEGFKHLCITPSLDAISFECEHGLSELERRGVSIVRRSGCSAIDVARNELASNALQDGFDSILFIDSDIKFDACDALRLFDSPEPVVSGLYAKKASRSLASAFPDDVTEIILGPDGPGLYPLKYAAAGFLRIRVEVLQTMIERLKLPFCNAGWGRGFWPFFQPLVVPLGCGNHHYLAEDWAFSHRLGLIGVTPMADATIRLWHIGRYGYSWEDAGAEPIRYRNYRYFLE